MNVLSGSSKLFIKKNASTILTCVGGAGVLATSITAVRTTPKAMRLIEQAKEKKGEDLTKIEVIKAAGYVYIPSMLIGVSTIACIFGANILNKRNQAALMSAYALLNNSYKEYQNKVKEIYGEEAHRSIKDSIALEKLDEVHVSGGYLGTNCDLSLEADTGELKTFYDEHSGRYFEATIEHVMNAEYHLNRNYILRGYSYLNEFYEFLGLKETDYGSVLGWAPNDDGMYWIDFNHRKITVDTGEEIYVIEMPFEPTYEALEDNYY